jgi:hypothetical protein
MTLILWNSEPEYIKANHEYKTREQIRLKTGFWFGCPAHNSCWWIQISSANNNSSH